MSTEITFESFIKNYWNYYLELERQLIQAKQYVEFDESNFKSFSIEYLKLLQITCSEIDAVGKIIANYYDEKFYLIKYANIPKWGFVIQNNIKDINILKVLFNKDIELLPWSKWKYEDFKDKKNQTRYRLKKGCETPFWWTAYNAVKHERMSYDENNKKNYLRANLKNLIYAMSALFVLETAFINELNKGVDNNYTHSSLFEMQ